MNKVFILGPEGTFSSMVYDRLDDYRADYEKVLIKSIPEIFVHLLNVENSLGVIPIENRSIGFIGLSQENLQLHDVEVIAELNMDVYFSLVANTASTEIKNLYAFQVSLNQCSEFLYKDINFSKHVETSSNIDSFSRFESEQLPDSAAIVPTPFSYSEQLSSKFHVKNCIQNDPENSTRFLIIRKKDPSLRFDFNKRKTTIFIDTKNDRPSLLYDILTQFNEFKINLTSLHSTPSKRNRGSYGFFIDFLNVDAESTKKCMKRIKSLDVNFQLFGAYDNIE